MRMSHDTDPTKGSAGPSFTAAAGGKQRGKKCCGEGAANAGGVGGKGLGGVTNAGGIGGKGLGGGGCVTARGSGGKDGCKGDDREGGDRNEIRSNFKLTVLDQSNPAVTRADPAVTRFDPSVTRPDTIACRPITVAPLHVSSNPEVSVITFIFYCTCTCVCLTHSDTETNSKPIIISFKTIVNVS